MERGNAAEGRGIRIGSDLHQVLDHLPLPPGVPVARPGHANDGRVQRLRAAPVPSVQVGTRGDETASDPDVVRECCSMQRGVARVNLRVALGEKELLLASDLRHRELGHLIEQLLRGSTFAAPDGSYKRREIFGRSHSERYRLGVHHVLLYGPPAAGKLTVAQALASRTGFRVVHNHLTTDLVGAVLDRGAPGFWDLVKDLRLRLFATAASRGIGVVSTTAYVPEDRPWIIEIEAAIREHGGRVHFAGLRPSVETLEQRVLHHSRQNHRKLQNVESLRAALREADYFSTINADDLIIDNSALTADETAKRIVAHFSLVQG